MKQPRTITCLCGSTRWPELFREANYQETRAGRIVLSIGCEWHGDDALRLTDDDKRELDDLHLDKIELAHEILVLNPGGYVGESTQREIHHATRLGKRVRYLTTGSTALIDVLSESETLLDADGGRNMFSGGRIIIHDMRRGHYAIMTHTLFDDEGNGYSIEVHDQVGDEDQLTYDNVFDSLERATLLLGEFDIPTDRGWYCASQRLLIQRIVASR